MEVQYHKWYSQALGRDMEYKTYGTWGQPILAFPSQDGRYFDWEDRDMIASMAPWIESGKVRVICCDGIDWETWTAWNNWDNRWRIEQHERWFRYIVDELLPNVRNFPEESFFTTGCSMGAFHAANAFFRRPDVFNGLIALSGLYDCHYGFPNYSDELTYQNSPIDFLWQMPEDHPWMQMYRERCIMVCVGQGNWEAELIESTRRLDTVLCAKHVHNAHFEYWGYDSHHDWPWWRNQIPVFLGKIFG